MDVADIKDKESLKTWLKSWPRATEAEQDHARKVAVQIAHRAAMRVLPWFWAWAVESRDRDLRGFAILRCSVIAGVAGKCPTPAIRPDAAADAAAYAAARAATAADAAAAAYAAAYAARAARAADAARAAYAAYAATAAADIWPHIRQDAATLRDGGDAMELPLWHDDASPLADKWQKVKDHYGNDPQWKFWIDWYENALQGRAQNWDMLTEIALIDSDTWEQGPDTVNPVIMGIVRNHAIAKSGNAEKVIVGADGLFDRVPLPYAAPDLYAVALGRVRDAITDMKAIPPGDNLIGACDADIERIEQYLIKYADTPLRIYEVLMRTIRHIDRRCHEGILPDGDERLEDFRTELDNSALDIMQNDNDVRSAIRLRASARFDRMSEAEKTHYSALMEFLAEHSAPDLAQEMREDKAAATDSETEETDKDDAVYRSGSRAMRMREQAVNLADDAAKIGKGGNAVWDFVSTIWQWFV